MSIEAALEANTAATLVNNSLLERLLAGQEAALAKIEPPKASRAPAAAKAKEPETPAPTAKEPETPAPTAEESTAAAFTPHIDPNDDDKMKAWVGGWMNADNGAHKPDRGAFMKSVLAEFGVSTLTNDTGIKGADNRQRAYFYFARKMAGLPVDFKADYDFASDPTAGPSAAAADDDGLG